ILHFLGVETAHLNSNPANWQKRSDEADGFDSRLGFGAERRWQPPSGSASIEPPWFAIACLASTPIAPIHAALHHLRADVITQMDLGLEEDLTVGCCSDSYLSRSCVHTHHCRLRVLGC